MRLLSPDNNVFSDITVETFLSGNELEVLFNIKSELKFDGLPKAEFSLSKADVKRHQGLWEKTCFEIFIKNLDGNDYFEFNFSPEFCAWNAFYFSNYRSKLKETDKIQFIRAECSSTYVKLLLNVPLGQTSFHPKVVLFNESQGTYLYLSDLTHPINGPDFHLFSTS